MIFGQLTAVGLWNLAKYLVVITFFHYDLRYWLDFWYVNLRRLEDTDLKQYFAILSLLRKELKKGETTISVYYIYKITYMYIKILIFILTCKCVHVTWNIYEMYKYISKIVKKNNNKIKLDVSERRVCPRRKY
jgi:hypothetical protein